ncbi:MAG: VOC family protein [Bacteroidota bacterium]
MAKKTIKKTAKKAARKTGKAAKKSAKKVAKKAAPKKVAKKAVKKIPVKAEPKTTTICPYLIFKDNCEEAFNFYRSVFGGKFSYLGRFKEMPPGDGMSVSASEGEKIMHVSLPISKETMLFGSDSSEAFGHSTVAGNNFSISINAKSQKEADRLYNGLSAGGMAVMPMAKTFWGSYFGMLTDKFGIQWQVSFGQ